MSNAVKLKKRAAELEQKRQFDKALALYIEVLEQGEAAGEEADVALHNRVGDLMFRVGNVAEALAYYEKAADLYAERGFLNNAIALCNKILRQSPGRTSIYYKLGRISATKGFKSDAKKNFLEYADRMRSAGRPDEAFRALREFADLCPDQDDVRLLLADQLSRENRPGEALEQLQTLHAKLEAEGRAVEARATVERMRAIDPDIMPRTTGETPVTRSSDLVFLDIGYDEPVTPQGPQAGRIPSGPTTPVSPLALEPMLPTASDELFSSTEVFAHGDPPAEPSDALDFIGGFTPTASASIDAPDALAVDGIETSLAFESLDTPVGDDFGSIGLEPTNQVPLEPAASLELGPAADLDLASTIDIDGAPESLADPATAPEIELLHAGGEVPGIPPLGEGWDIALDAQTQRDLSPVPLFVDAELDELSFATDAEPDEAPPVASGLALSWPEEVDDAPRESDASPLDELPLLIDASSLLDADEPAAEPRLASFDEPAIEASSGSFDESADDPWVVAHDPAPVECQVASAPVDELASPIETAPDDWGLRRRYAETLLESGERAAGLAQLEGTMLGLEQEHRLEEAEELLDELVRLAPDVVRHHQKRVELAARINDRSRLIASYVELAEALFRSGEPGKSAAVFRRVLELAPDDARARAGMELATSQAHAPESTPVGVPAVTPPARRTPIATASFQAHAVPTPVRSATPVPRPSAPGGASAALAGPVESPAGRPPVPADGAEGGFVDLGDWLRSQEPRKSTRMYTDAPQPTGDEDADFAEMLRRFKQGIETNVEEEDSDSHYDLGIAYKEMGLVDEAIAEFQKALRGAERRVRTYEALGQCFLEKRQYAVAATVLSRALESAPGDDHQLVGVLYLSGYAAEALQRWREALVFYQRVFAVDIQFRDVAERLTSMERLVK